MVHQYRLTWQQESDTSWSAVTDDRVVARISFGRQYEIVSADGAVRGSHSALGSAQAQLDAWYQWESSVSGS